MSIEKIVFDKEYEGPVDAFVDWIAGGNFDGYLYKTSLRFTQAESKVVLTTKIIDQSKFDDRNAHDQDAVGTFSVTDKSAIVCQFGDFEMRGSVVGKEHEFIAFSCWRNKDRANAYSTVYKLTEG
ncbi:hypothetical protein [Chitinophaga silvisoli]|uniref:Uncharacterized protein n=1 Tax=Chitinophaga silvisoli TaxID=2291814 RepID=A0A3E1NU23_9BACT|nr:hypothetical protein [Chitinophaga silvisoli]RFM31432.1 hypothetical protein DXN04_29065 [Chitinophaga silvisoli]